MGSYGVKADATRQAPIACPVCGKVFGEWVHVKGEATIKKWCPRCKAFRYISTGG